MLLKISVSRCGDDLSLDVSGLQAPRLRSPFHGLDRSHPHPKVITVAFMLAISLAGS